MTNFALRAGFTFLIATACAKAALASSVTRIAIRDLDFIPATITVRLGDSVEWVNHDIVEHTATDRSGAFDLVTPKGKAARVKMTKPGTIEYYCRLHPNMVGVIKVVK